MVLNIGSQAHVQKSGGYSSLRFGLGSSFDHSLRLRNLLGCRFRFGLWPLSVLATGLTLLVACSLIVSHHGPNVCINSKTADDFSAEISCGVT